MDFTSMSDVADDNASVATACQGSSQAKNCFSWQSQLQQVLASHYQTQLSNYSRGILFHF